MLRNIIDLLEDLGDYGKVIRDRQKRQRPGEGIDYTSRKYREAVRRAVERLHPKQMRLRVAEIIRDTPSTKTFRLTREDGDLPPFRAGQYVNLFVTIDKVLTSRPYSISSPPGREYIDLTVRNRPGGFVAPYLLRKIKKGDVLNSTGPTGSFYYEPLIDGHDLVFLAGGSGITPFMSILRRQAEMDWPQRITLLYGSRRIQDVIFDKELARLAQASERFNYARIISEPPKNFRGLKGFIDAKTIRKFAGEAEDKTFYICGPNAMFDFCLPELAKFGALPHKIKRELYGPPDDVTREPGWPKKVKPETMFRVRVNGRDIKARAGEPLLNSLERQGVVAPAVCRSGECSACRTKLIEGRVYMPPHTGVREADRQYGYIHACVSYPLSDLVIAI